MSMTGDYRSMSEVDGQYASTAWVPYVDFDPSDAEDMEIMGHVWGREKADREARLERENERLRTRLAELTGEED